MSEDRGRCDHLADDGCMWCCPRCDHDVHRCYGCGAPADHHDTTCPQCLSDYEPTS